MTKHKSFVAIAAALGLWTSAAHAEDNLKIGLIATLSGPPAVLGQQLRNGFCARGQTAGRQARRPHRRNRRRR